jgi:hypothetical protein
MRPIQPVLEGAESAWLLLDGAGAGLPLLGDQAALFQAVTGSFTDPPGWLQAAGWGALSASGLLIGAAGGSYRSLEHTAVARTSSESPQFNGLLLVVGFVALLLLLALSH